MLPFKNIFYMTYPTASTIAVEDFVYKGKKDADIGDYMLESFKSEKRVHRHVCKILQINGDEVMGLKSLKTTSE